MTTTMSLDELRGLPPVVDIATAGRVLGLGRDRAYEEAKRAGGMIPTIEVGERRRKVPTAELLRGIGIDYTNAGIGTALPEPRPGRSWRVDTSARAAQ